MPLTFGLDGGRLFVKVKKEEKLFVRSSIGSLKYLRAHNLKHVPLVVFTKQTLLDYVHDKFKKKLKGQRKLNEALKSFILFFHSSF